MSLGCRAVSCEAEFNVASFTLPNGVVDYYELLGVDDDAHPSEIKAAYRALAKQCHPDFLGDAGHNACILLNEAYAVLSDPHARQRYNHELETAMKDQDDGYTGEPLSEWMPSLQPMQATNTDPAESRAVFVDEFTCIGCKNCTMCAASTFMIEEQWGRSRVIAQWADVEDDLQAAIDSCPVSCIHWVDKQQLAALEWVMQNRCSRTGVAQMMAGQGDAGADVFEMATKFVKQRQQKEQRRARNTRYTAAQEEARRQAAEEVRRKHMGWFSSFADMFSGAVQGMGHTVGDTKRVGSRKRHRSQYAAAPAAVPPERALIPIAVADRSQNRGMH